METNLAWEEGMTGRLPRRTVSKQRPLKWLGESLARRLNEARTTWTDVYREIGHNRPEKLHGWKRSEMSPSGAREEGRRQSCGISRHMNEPWELLSRHTSVTMLFLFS